MSAGAGCGRAVELLARYLDDALEPRERTRLLHHLQACPACAARLARYRQHDLALRRLPSPAWQPGRVDWSRRTRSRRRAAEASTLIGLMLLAALGFAIAHTAPLPASITISPNALPLLPGVVATVATTATGSALNPAADADDFAADPGRVGGIAGGASPEARPVDARPAGETESGLPAPAAGAGGAAAVGSMPSLERVRLDPAVRAITPRHLPAGASLDHVGLAWTGIELRYRLPGGAAVRVSRHLTGPAVAAQTVAGGPAITVSAGAGSTGVTGSRPGGAMPTPAGRTEWVRLPNGAWRLSGAPHPGKEPAALALTLERQGVLYQVEGPLPLDELRRIAASIDVQEGGSADDRRP